MPHPSANAGGQRLLIFIVAYNAEKTLASVLARIPESLRTASVDVLVIDDSSRDQTFEAGIAAERSHGDFNLTVLRTPINQGYGGNQKLGYRYAIEHGYDLVALLHGDGQYAPEKLPDLLTPFAEGAADAVFGSRMIDKKAALHGGMPLYKWLGNQTLTAFQNRMLGTHFSEFHSGYRIYATRALERVPFERNSNDFHFDTEIIVQFVMAGLRIKELPIPTYYGDEICHVDGLKYAWDVFRTMLRAKFHAHNLLYDRKFDLKPPEETYDLKVGFQSSHTMALAIAKSGGRVLDLGCGRGYVAEKLAAETGWVTAIDEHVPAESPLPNLEYIAWDLNTNRLPIDASDYDQIYLLDIIEHLTAPEQFMEMLREASALRRLEIIITTANIGFVVTRLLLFFGHFNYGRKGILDRTHKRLFTFAAFHELLEEAGFTILESTGIPAPYPKALGDNPLSQFLVKLNALLIRINKRLFGYQIFVRAQANPTVSHLLRETEAMSSAMKGDSLQNHERAH